MVITFDEVEKGACVPVDAGREEAIPLGAGVVDLAFLSDGV